MAEITGLADDLDGTPQWVRPVTRHTLAIDGEEHVVDLHEEHLAQMRADLAKWIKASRAIGNDTRDDTRVAALKQAPPAAPAVKQAVTTKKPKGKKGHRDPLQLKAERDYLRSIGHQVSPYGKVPDVLHALWEQHLEDLKQQKGQQQQGGFSGSPFGSELFLAAAN